MSLRVNYYFKIQVINVKRLLIWPIYRNKLTAKWKFVPYVSSLFRKHMKYTSNQISETIKSLQVNASQLSFCIILFIRIFWKLKKKLQNYFKMKVRFKKSTAFIFIANRLFHTGCIYWNLYRLFRLYIYSVRPLYKPLYRCPISKLSTYSESSWPCGRF